MKETLIPRYDVGKGNRTVKIALVSDNHGWEPKGVFEMIEAEKPDIIALAGDIFEEHEIEFDSTEYKKNFGDKDIFIKIARVIQNFLLFAAAKSGYDKSDNISAQAFVKKLKTVAPCFYSIGNHDRHLKTDDFEFLNDNGIILLDNRSVMYKDILIGGFSEYPDEEFIKKFSSENLPKILLCHRPEFFVKFKPAANITLSGHAHGGQWRFFGKGIYSPGQGIFPKLTRGLYFDNKLVVSAGLIYSSGIPRINNPVEVPIITLHY